MTYMGASFKESNGITSTGIGYKLNRKTWNDAAKKGLQKVIIKRLEIFDRPVTAEQIAQRINTDATDPEILRIKEMMEKMASTGIIKKSNEETYTL